MADYELEPFRWGGPGTVVTWSFATSNIAGQHFSFDGFLSGQFLAEIRLAFDRWEQVANIDFVEVADSSSSQLRLGFDFIDGVGNVAGEAWNSYRTTPRGKVEVCGQQCYRNAGQPGQRSFQVRGRGLRPGLP